MIRYNIVVFYYFRLQTKIPSIKTVYNKVKNHSWYLHESLIPLSLFDERIPKKTKSLMVKNLLSKPSKLEKKDMKTAYDNEKCISQFFSKNSEIFFKILELPMDFLKVDPSEWTNTPSYIFCLTKVKQLVVVNDAAERAVGVLKEFGTDKRFKSFDTLEKKIMVVAENRKKKS